MSEPPAVLVDIACDYLRAALSGQPIFAETVADNYGPSRVSRGMATLLVYLAIDAAHRTDVTPESIVERMRETYGRTAEGATS
jgi:hypothetical protein